MPSVVCESAAVSVNAAIRDSLAGSPYLGSSGSSSSSTTTTQEDSLQNKLVSTAKRVLLSKIEYEEVKNYNQSVLDAFKSKYIVLKPTPQLPTGQSGKSTQAPATKTTSDKDTNQNTAGTETMPYNSTSSTNSSEKQQRNACELPQPKKILFPRENIQIGWKSSNRKWNIGAGMMNVGNTCYLNSTLQALFHVPSIANWLVSDAAHMEKCEEENGTQGGCIICAVAKTLISSQQQQTAIRPYLVYSKLKLICRHLIMGRQEDAHEFLRYLVEAMEKAYLTRFRNYKDMDQYTKETTPPNQILGGYLKSAVRCMACGHVSTTFQHFEDLLLDIRKADTIEEALEGYFSRERLEDMGYKCESCKKKVSATKQFTLERAPIALCIQLKRFSMLGTKLSKQITIRPRIDLSKYASKKNAELLTYKLVAMVTHLGASQHCGHYTAIGLTESGTYYSFDDSYVRPISIQNVINTNAYILFYEMEPIQQHNGQTAIASIRTSTIVNGGNQVKENLQKNGNNSSANTGYIYKEQKIIGPQMPDYYKTTINNHNTTNGFPGTGNKLVSSPSKLSNRPSSLPTSTSKIMIHFKNSPNNIATSAACTSSATSSAATSSTDPLKNIIPLNSDSEEDEDEQVTTTTIKQATENEVTSTTTTLLVPALPCMPLLTSDSPTRFSDKNSALRQQSSISATTTAIATSTTATNNGLVKSLVPYESGSEDNLSNGDNILSSSDNDDKMFGKKFPPITSTSGKPKKKKKKLDSSNDHGTNNSFVSSATIDLCKSSSSNYDENSQESTDSAESRIPLDESTTPPSPQTIVTKTGLWQVTSVRETNSKTLPEKKYKNPFSSTTTTHAVSRNGKHINGSSSNHSNKSIKTKSTTIQPKTNSTDNHGGNNDMLMPSHRGYGASVYSWNGTKSELEKEIAEESRLQRKREWEEDEENEMDRGRQKKVKNHKPPSSNPGFNPFQEQQSHQNHYRRWKLINNVINHRYHNTTSSQFRLGTSFNRKMNFKRFGTKFHQRHHHHRGNGNEFHRRTS